MTADEIHDENLKEFADAMGVCADAITVRQCAGFTKGPWEARDGEVTTRQITGRSFRRIAVIQDYGVGCLKETDEANAHLIAAAPSLYHACKLLILAYEGGEPGDSVSWEDIDDAVSAAFEAVREAEGTPAS